MNINLSTLLRECKRRDVLDIVENQFYRVSGDSATERLHLENSGGRAACGVYLLGPTRRETLDRLLNRQNRCEACFRGLTHPPHHIREDASWEFLSLVSAYLLLRERVEYWKKVAGTGGLVRIQDVLYRAGILTSPIDYDRHPLHRPWKPLLDSLERDTQKQCEIMRVLVCTSENQSRWTSLSQERHPQADPHQQVLLGWAVSRLLLTHEAWLGKDSAEILQAWPAASHVHGKDYTHVVVPAPVAEHLIEATSETRIKLYVTTRVPQDPVVLETALGLWSPQREDDILSDLAAAVNAAEALHKE